MKRFFKIIGWTVLSLVLVVVAVFCIALYVIFTPERVTPIARQFASQYITCEYEIGSVDLTFFSTFPRFGFRAENLQLINPKAGTQNDTVVATTCLTATVDVREFIRNRNLHLHEAVLHNARVNFYIAPDGTNNLTEVFVTAPDTATEDTASFALPFNGLQVDALQLQAKYITFVDEKDTIRASLGATTLNANAQSWDEIMVDFQAQDVCATIRDEVYADHLQLALHAPLALDLNTMHIALHDAFVEVNDTYRLSLDGTVDKADDLRLDITVETNEWQIKSAMSLVPKVFLKPLKDIDIDGKAQLKAIIRGTLNDTRMPLVKARLILKEGHGSYAPLPYILRDMALETVATIDLNKEQPSNATIRHLEAKTRQSHLTAKGEVKDILGDMLLDLNLGLNANLPDFAYFLPKEMKLAGHADGSLDARIRLKDLTDMRLEKGTFNADLRLSDIHYDMDPVVADLPRTHARIHMPNNRPTHKTLHWARIDLETDKADVEMTMPLKAKLQASKIELEAGNILSNNPVLYASVVLQSAKPLHVEMDSMDVTVNAPQLTLYTEYNLKDTTVMPLVDAQLDCQALDGFWKDIKANLKQSHLEAGLHSENGSKERPKLRAILSTMGLATTIGSELDAVTGLLDLDAAAQYDPNGENLLLQWNPQLRVNLKDGELTLPGRLPETVYIPSIEYSYLNHEMAIDNSRIELGKSDLNLKGSVRNIGAWFRHEAVLDGELEVISDHCDANQLLAWFSADKGSEEKEPAPKNEIVTDSIPADSLQNVQKDPFLVPTDVNLALNTQLKEVEIFNQDAKDVRGGIYLQNGVLILDEVGFVCRAAKLQLTAMYRTPRRNHIYLGLDYHMLDVDIDELIAMIPNIEQMVPMLGSFKGAAEFHLAAETYMNSQYQPKMSTLRGAASLTGKDLVVLDGETFSQISKLLKFNKKTENRIDSLNAEMTIYKNEIDIYPLCVQMDNYMVALGGRHNTNMSFDYDINVLSPIYLGVNVSGTIDDLKIKLAKCKFAQDFRPRWFDKADTQSLELRQRIKQSMEKNVRIK